MASAMMTVAPLRASASPNASRRASRVSSRVVAPAGLRRSAVIVQGRRSSAATIRADAMKDAMEKYNEITYKIPPVLTAAAVPVVALSLLCKTLTGHGLPGTLLGSIEGISWLVLPLGAGALAPKLGDLGKAGDVGEAIKILTTEGKAYEGFGQDSRGKNATERLASITKTVDPNSPLGQQMADIAKREAELAAETPEQKAAREKLRAELAAEALGLGKNISTDSEKEADEKGRDGLLAKPVTQTLKESMTVENYDVDVTKYDDKALGNKLNLSSPDVEKGAPKNNAGDKWREQYRQEGEDQAGAAE
ncbi:uncharacterized protein MICPUCDRAFT_57609 [Micromonas pusilla CCMP1545]|jgi:hypothetical protein|uniref:Uncharacterized protein n=2 Tax=Micromonas pusilla TaxID=38833 RepID=C1MRC9_MICPC|nr:uncharacterized protein MICPUCDRAFT_57609 [Micromonas pusilla CCMP1545]EEH57857.1 hypothetical protein MICPUCDRAFT_57609 [Micromonas pusilla CCMP1545]|eukprot:XP_003057906.1 hypothetical protein MICPUCDRAFT_57609 [Micromonas pusilla CCMP1545]